MYHRIFGLVLYSGKDRYKQPFIALSRGNQDVVWGRELRITIGGWSCFCFSKTNLAIGRFWMDYH
jgi:hypothetical protein